MKPAFLLLVPALALSQDVPRLSLSQALALAREGNTGVLRARSQSSQARSDLSAASAGLWPTLSASSDLARLGPNLAGDPRYNPASTLKSSADEQWLTTLSARWVVFDGLATTSARASKKSLVAASRARESNQELSTAAQVVVAYREVARQQRLQESDLRELDVSRERFSIARSRLEVGTASLLDAQQAEVDLNADSSALLRQNLAVDQSRRQLNWLLGRDPEIRFSVDDSIPLFALPPRDELVREARERSPVLAEARARSEAAAADERGARSPFLPVVSLYSNYNFLDQLRDAHPPANGYWQVWQYGAQVTLSVFNGGADRARKGALGEVARQAEIGLREAELALSRDISQAYAAAEQALVDATLESRNAALAESTLRLAQGRFQAGGLSGIDLRRVQESSLQASVRAVSSRTEAGAAQVRLFLLAGRSLP